MPATLNWTPALQFPTWQGGSLALLYKIFLILPAVHLVTFGLSLLASALAGLYPAWRIGRTAPAVYLKTQ